MSKNPFKRQPGDEIYTINFAGTRVPMHKHNTLIYEFDNQHEGDHVFTARKSTESGELVGSPLWAIEVIAKHGRSTWSQICAGLIDVGCENKVETTMPEGDIDMFYKHFGRFPVLDSVELVYQELTPRQELRPQWIRYLLDNMLLVPEHFESAVDSIL